jgi:hypothetical protein
MSTVAVSAYYPIWDLYLPVCRSIRSKLSEYQGSNQDALQFEKYRQIISSDAHNLGSILEQVFFIELNEIEINALLNWLNTTKAGDEI